MQWFVFELLREGPEPLIRAVLPGEQSDMSSEPLELAEMICEVDQAFVEKVCPESLPMCVGAPEVFGEYLHAKKIS